MSQAEADAARAHVRPIAHVPEIGPADLVVEAIVEDLEAKRALFARLEAIVRPDAVLATNTSSLSVTAIASACTRPERVAGWHFFNPVPLMKVVEVIAGPRTEPAILDRLAALAAAAGHRAVRCADSPGFIVNHAGRGFGTEALQIVVAEGAAEFADVDRALRDQVGFRLGPFELLDLTGLDVSQPVMESIFRQFHGEPRYRPSWLLKQRLDAGLLGRKSGAGFYAYRDGKPDQPPERPAPAGEPRAVAIRADRPDWAEALRRVADAAGWPVEEAARPGGLTLLAPLGRDCTTAALDAGVAPEDAVAVDCLFGLHKRRVVMGSPATRPDALAAAHALLAADGTPVTVIRDSVGFVAQRTVATIVNIACDMAQARIASPADIDDAVRLGLNYPLGPLALGDQVGAPTIAKILDGLHAASGDPRYRPSPWLRRRAALGLPLAAA
jgi:3-hydroxybutyryl-CoA dehydrogenase